MSAHATLRDAILYFADFEQCHKFMVDLRWSDGVVKCPVCGSEKVTYLAKNRVWKCYAPHPKPRFSLKTGTIFEDSPIGLEKWLPVVWMILNCKNGISSWELHRAVGVTQKTAWFMLHRIRLAMQRDRKSTRLNSSHLGISYAVFCLKKKNTRESHKGSTHHGRGSISRKGPDPGA